MGGKRAPQAQQQVLWRLTVLAGWMLRQCPSSLDRVLEPTGAGVISSVIRPFLESASGFRPEAPTPGDSSRMGASRGAWTQVKRFGGSFRSRTPHRRPSGGRQAGFAPVIRRFAVSVGHRGPPWLRSTSPGRTILPSRSSSTWRLRTYMHECTLTMGGPK